MKLISGRKELLKHLDSHKGTLGLVPTMGALHEGHLSLVKKAISENDTVLVTIFVNPTQFNNPEDLEKYPKTLEEDLSLLNSVDQGIIVFAPSIEELYGEEVTSKEYFFDGLDKVMEGAFRPGHFNGVATVVQKLFELIRPDKAYFGEKDFQQLQIVRNLARTLPFSLQIVGCPIVREAQGLAMSSRNRLLSEEMRKKAGLIYQTLEKARCMFGTENATKVIAYVKEVFSAQKDMDLEYFQIADEETLTPVMKKQKNRKYRGFIAVYAEGIRLIDNIAMN
ncbi:pantoate--beta-alanine ligase [Muriicola marianensis]|uniref:Pantothenate synthetase n=1 Tax=Muriicola marianensis TaxID=1324801 RepID=A0ABQ1R1R6_9FLAO|nr:pantoate--beta-alanine ligase [Muriicola marianensis]GGD51956.1 pantothenate synthetase [Muriicola marianensis]